MLDLGTGFLASVARDPDALALVDGDVRLSYAEWLKKISSLVAAFERMGLKPGDHLLTALQNNWQAATVHWACQLAGLIITPVNWRVNAGELDFCIENSESRALVCQDVSESAVAASTRASDLIVMRAGGMSVWQFLSPAILLVLGIGVFFVTIYSPVSAAMLARFERIEAKYITGKTSLLAVSSSGLWIRQVEHENPEVKEHIFHALRVAQKGATLADVIVFSFDDGNRFTGVGGDGDQRGVDGGRADQPQLVERRGIAPADVDQRHLRREPA